MRYCGLQEQCRRSADETIRPSTFRQIWNSGACSRQEGKAALKHSMTSFPLHRGVHRCDHWNKSTDATETGKDEVRLQVAIRIEKMVKNNVYITWVSRKSERCSAMQNNEKESSPHSLLSAIRFQLPQYPPLQFAGGGHGQLLHNFDFLWVFIRCQLAAYMRLQFGNQVLICA
jgi:hypothetical protein